MSLNKLKPILSLFNETCLKTCLQLNISRGIRVYSFETLSKDAKNDNKSIKETKSSSSSSSSSSSDSSDDEKSKKVDPLLRYKNVVVSMKKPKLPDMISKSSAINLSKPKAKLTKPEKEKSKTVNVAEKEAALGVAKLINKAEPEKVVKELMKPLKKEEPKLEKKEEKSTDEAISQKADDILM